MTVLARTNSNLPDREMHIFTVQTNVVRKASWLHLAVTVRSKQAHKKLGACTLLANNDPPSSGKAECIQKRERD
jgi:hypothetical protein